MGDILHDISWVVPYRHEVLTPIFEAFTWIGYSTFIMILLALGYWLWNKNSITRLAIIVMISAVLNAFLKDLWQNPRPDALFRLDPEVGKSFGMPSGHAQVSAVLWFWLAYEIRKPWAWWTATLIVAGVCSSRIYLGIHDLEDILAGLALAAVTLVCYRWVLKERFDRFRSLPLVSHLLLILVVQILVYFVWPGHAYSISAIVLGSFLVAWLLGVYLETNYVGFVLRDGVWAIVITAILGIAGLILLNGLLKPLLSSLDPLFAGNLRVAITALYITAIAPWIFGLIGLRKPNS